MTVEPMILIDVEDVTDVLVVTLAEALAGEAPVPTASPVIVDVISATTTVDPLSMASCVVERDILGEDVELVKVAFETELGAGCALGDTQ